MFRYDIRISHGTFEWSVLKRYRHFHDLHKSLVQFVEAETKRNITELGGYEELPL